MFLFRNILPGVQASMEILVRPMRQQDLAPADRIFRLAFGTEFGLPDPAQFMGDAALIAPRWHTHPETCFVAEAAGEVIGSVAVMNWGSLAILGPLTIHPDHWNQRVARRLLPPVLAAAETQGARIVGLYTNPSSPRHLRLYEDFGFVAQTLMAVMARPVEAAARARPLTLFSALTANEKAEALVACAQVSAAILPGLDPRREIEAADRQGTGDTLLLRGRDGIGGFALCQEGPGSEAGSGTLSIKFGAVRPGATEDFVALLAAAEGLAARRGAATLQASTNHARRKAYEAMKASGFRTRLSGVAMLRPPAESYDRPEILVADEWR